ncbi:MAG: 2-oxoacid:acceptor oxidoreductase family protein [Candidatus Eisenbacteria bacterium]|nr:2-oxoacid:acceptor oxidoreductase family protein [Candidatus Eisenbacteria bacterium]
MNPKQTGIDSHPGRNSGSLPAGSEVAVRLSGEGGQGLILAGVILAEAAFVFDGKMVAQTENYGPEARGGKSASDVIISSEEIDTPKVTFLDFLLCLTPESLKSYLPRVKKNGTVIADTTTIKEFPEATQRIVKIPLKRLTRERLGTEVATNVVSLGVLREVTGIVSRDALLKAVEGRVPKKSLDLNRRALELGSELGREVCGG